MKMKRIANNVALQTIGYVISGFTNVYIYVRECGYQKRDIYRGLYKHFAHDEMNKYAYCKITELRADENVLYIGIEEERGKGAIRNEYNTIQNPFMGIRRRSVRRKRRYLRQLRGSGSAVQ